MGNSMSWPPVLVVFSRSSLVVQFLGGRDTVELSVGQAELMGEPGV